MWSYESLGKSAYYLGRHTLMRIIVPGSSVCIVWCLDKHFGVWEQYDSEHKNK